MDMFNPQFDPLAELEALNIKLVGQQHAINQLITHNNQLHELLTSQTQQHQRLVKTYQDLNQRLAELETKQFFAEIEQSTK